MLGLRGGANSRLLSIGLVALIVLLAVRAGAQEPSPAAEATPEAAATSPQIEDVAAEPSNVQVLMRDAISLVSSLLSPMTEVQARTFPFTPPLSFNDVLTLLGRVRGQLELAAADTPPNPLRLELIAEALRQAYLFVRHHDQRLMTLDRYTWQLVGERRVAAGVSTKVDMIMADTTRASSIIAFGVSRGTAVLDQLEAYDLNNEPMEVDWPGRPLVLFDVPRREAVHLLLPGRISRLTFDLVTDERSRATLQVYLGSSDDEEDAKRALWLLGQAQARVEAGGYHDAARIIREAEQAIVDFKWHHGL